MDLLLGIIIGLEVGIIAVLLSKKRVKRPDIGNMWRRFKYYHLGGKAKIEAAELEAKKRGFPFGLGGGGRNNTDFIKWWKDNAHGLSLGTKEEVKNPIQQVKEMVAKEKEKLKKHGTTNKRGTKSSS